MQFAVIAEKWTLVAAPLLGDTSLAESGEAISHVDETIGFKSDTREGDVIICDTTTRTLKKVPEK